MRKIIFIGLGNMGLPMASRLSEAFPDVVCYDILPEACQTAAAAGLTVVEKLAPAVADARAVITMLPTGKHVGAVLTGAHGLFTAAAKETLFIDSSTTSPAEARQFAAAAELAGVVFVDAPVSGGIAAAKAGTLSFLVGGGDVIFENARPLLAAMGANIFHAGQSGDGQAAKVCNNMMLSIQMVGTCEALALGEKMGLDAGVLSDIMKKSSGGNWVVEKYNPMPGVMQNVPAAKEYQGGFVVDLMVKDSDLALVAAAENDAQTPLAALANQLFRLHRKKGNGRLDFSSILNMFR